MEDAGRAVFWRRERTWTGDWRKVDRESNRLPILELLDTAVRWIVEYYGSVEQMLQ
jgi:hypothetical protein